MGKLRKGLIKKGAPLPGKPSFKFESSHLKKTAADEAEFKLMARTDIKETRQLRIPRQYAVYGQKAPRITPKMRKLR